MKSVRGLYYEALNNLNFQLQGTDELSKHFLLLLPTSLIVDGSGIDSYSTLQIVLCYISIYRINFEDEYYDIIDKIAKYRADELTLGLFPVMRFFNHLFNNVQCFFALTDGNFFNGRNGNVRQRKIVNFTLEFLDRFTTIFKNVYYDYYNDALMLDENDRQSDLTDI